MEAINELNNKWWYRLLKVVYLIVLIAGILFIVLMVYSSNGPQFDNNASYIKCSNGKEVQLKSNDIFLYYDFLSPGDQKIAEGKCFDGMISSSTDEFGKVKYKIASETDNSRKYNLVSVYTERNWSEIFLYILIGCFSLIAVFETIRRIFYYVILGSFTPKK
jgi:energy-coupling factor transporter transmembrane protein EcfT